MLHPDLWTTFVSAERCLGAHRLEYPEWHKGRPRYYLWAIDADVAPIGERLALWRERLRAYLVAPCSRQPHVTVAVCGFLSDVGAAPRSGTPDALDDDVTPSQLDEQTERLRALAPAPFTLRIGGLNAFASAPFLEVDDVSGALARLRAALAPANAEFRTTPYVPHVTVGVFNGDYPVARLLPLMRDGRGSADPLPLAVGAVGLYSYDATHVASPLRVERRLDLRGEVD